jgi:hypothetical protein
LARTAILQIRRNQARDDATRIALDPPKPELIRTRRVRGRTMCRKDDIKPLFTPQCRRAAALSAARSIDSDGETLMAVSPARARDLALALPGASETPHFHRLAFRTPRKIFATLDELARDLNLMFDPDLRDFYCEQAPHAFTPVAGGWGRNGATRCDLGQVDEATLRSALLAPHHLALPRPRPKRR